MTVSNLEKRGVHQILGASWRQDPELCTCWLSGSRFAFIHASRLRLRGCTATANFASSLARPGADMKVKIKNWHAIAQWRWDAGSEDANEADGEGDVCGICRVPYEGCCPACKMPGDDCPLSESPLL